MKPKNARCGVGNPIAPPGVNDSPAQRKYLVVTSR
jgi:hypothetical protein